MGESALAATAAGKLIEPRRERGAERCSYLVAIPAVGLGRAVTRDQVGVCGVHVCQYIHADRGGQ